MSEYSVVKKKLAKLVEFLSELEQVKSANFSHYKTNPAVKRSCERLIQLIVESAADINSEVIVQQSSPPPADYYGSFIKAGEVGLIPSHLAKKLAPWAGLRNRIVHEYEDIRDRIVFEKIIPTINLFYDYVGYVRKFLKQEVN